VNLSDLKISDGKVVEFTVQSNVATVTFKDWQEKTYLILFRDFVGFESYSPENIDLSHISVSTDSTKA